LGEDSYFALHHSCGLLKGHGWVPLCSTIDAGVPFASNVVSSTVNPSWEEYLRLLAICIGGLQVAKMWFSRC
jgi:hypothetical protein